MAGGSGGGEVTADYWVIEIIDSPKALSGVIPTVHTTQQNLSSAGVEDPGAPPETGGQPEPTNNFCGILGAAGTDDFCYANSLRSLAAIDLNNGTFNYII